MFRFFNDDRFNDTNEVLEYRLLQPIWDLRLYGESYIASPVFPVVLTVSTYFVLCSLFGMLDMLGKNWAIVQKYRLQPDKEITWTMVARAMRMTVCNNLLFILPATISQWIWVPPTPFPRMAPTLFDFCYQMWAILMLFDFQYFVWHVCHHKNRWLYRNFHSLHHQYHSTFSWTTQYLHPWELFTVGLFATVDGWFFDCHPMVYWAFMVLNIVMSVDAHAGFDIPFFPHHWIPFGIYGGGPKHDMHHMKPLTNFQPFFSTFDRLFGWECPGLRAGGAKTEEFHEWELRNKAKRFAQNATVLMKGTVNGQLKVNDDEYGNRNIRISKQVKTD